MILVNHLTVAISVACRFAALRMRSLNSVSRSIRVYYSVAGTNAEDLPAAAHVELSGLDALGNAIMMLLRILCKYIGNAVILDKISD